MSSSHDVISASEVGQWVYCQRAWVLSREGESNSNVGALLRGEKYHYRYGLGFETSRVLFWIGAVLMFLGALVL